MEVKGLEAKIVSTGQQILNGVNLTIREVGNSLTCMAKYSDALE